MKINTKNKGKLIILACLFVILLNIFLIRYFNKPTTFDQIKTNETLIAECLDNNYQNSKNTTVILYRNNCPYCKNVESLITKQVANNRSGRFIVIDVSKISNKQKVELIDRIPELTYEGRLVTPTVVSLQKARGNKWAVTKKVIGDDKKQIRNILSSKSAVYSAVL